MAFAQPSSLTRVVRCWSGTWPGNSEISKLDQAAAHRFDDSFGARRSTELHHHNDVELRGVIADAEAIGDEVARRAAPHGRTDERARVAHALGLGIRPNA